MTIALHGLRGRLLMLTVAAVGFLCVPVAAEAALVTRDDNTLIITEDTPGGPGGIGGSQVQHTNNITVVLDGTDYVVTDTGGNNPTTQFNVQNNCTAVAGTVRCPAAGITEIDVDAGELRDVIDLDDPSLPDNLTSNVRGGTGADELRGLDGGADTLSGQDDGDSLFGNAGNDTLSGGQGEDVLRGGEGNDTLRGGADADDFHGDGGTDTVDYSTDGTQGVDAKIDPAYKSGAGCVNGGGDGCEGDQINTSVENLTGTPGNDVLTGSEDVGNTLTGLGGNDRLYGLSGGDALDGGAGNDELYGASGADTLSGGTGDDRLQGGDDADVINGGGDAGDVVDYTDRVGAKIDSVTVDLGVATPTQGGARDGNPGARDTITGVNHADTGDGNDTLTGNNNANTFNTAGGDDTMNGKGGNDTFNAGAGNDSMTGEAGNDTFNAGDGDDTMNGGAGADTFNGGAGERDHVTYVDDPDDADGDAGRVVVTIGGAPGDDGSTNDGASGSRDTVGSDVEDVTGGPDNDSITGSSNDNILRGGDGNDTLAGLGGPDLLYGDAGFDTVTYAQPERTTPVIVDLDATADDGNELDGTAEVPTARDLVDGASVEAIIGGSGSDRLTGNELANSLSGGNGDDILLGGLGADTFNGGAGEDTVIYKDDGRPAGTGVIVSIGDSANDGTAGSEGDNVGADVENLVGTESNDTLTGDLDPNKIFGLGGTDTIAGNAGDDVLDGGAGSGDQLDGGGGDDLLHLGSDGPGSDGADSVNGSVGDDTVTYASVFVTSPNHPLAGFASQERSAPVRVTLAGGADDGQITPAENDSILGVENAIGGAGDDQLVGTTSANTLEGRSGDDTLTPGNETGTVSDTLIGGPGAHDLADYSDRDSHDLVITLDGEANDGLGGEGGESDDIRSDVEDVTTGDGNDTVTGDSATSNRIITAGGNDVVKTDDTTADDVTCGTGSDSVTADHRDAVSECENQTFTTKAKLSVADAQVSEGTGGVTSLQFKVTVDAAPGSAVTFQYATSEGTATEPEDYTHTSGTGTIPAGATETTITVPVNPDAIDEPNETLTLTITSPSSNGEILDGTATGTIVDDEGTPTVSVGDAQVDEGNTGTQVVNVPITLSGPSNQDVTVKYSTGGGEATPGSDYTAVTNGTVTIPAGQTTANAPVTIAGDTTDEVNETFVVTLTEPSSNATLGDPTGTVTINDNDDAPTLSIADAKVTEGNAGNKTLSFTVTLSQASGKPVTFNYSTTNGTATAGANGDYVAATNVPVTIQPGSTTGTVDVTVRGDTAPEADETFTVTLGNVQNATVTDGTATGTIEDDDKPGLSVSDATVTEGDTNAQFTVTLSEASAQTVTVAYTTADGSATEPADYTKTSGTLTFAPGETSKTVDVPVKEDALDETDETFTLELSSPTAANVTDASGTGTITDDDAAPSLSVADITVKEGDSGTTEATFTISLSEASGRPVEVKFATSNGTAEIGSDLPASGGLVSFTPGTTERQVTVPITGDTVDEADETFKFTLSEPSNATIGDGEATGTITDDDTAAVVKPAISVGDIKVAEGDTGTTPAVFTVTLSAPTTATVTVKYVTSDGTATSGSDYAVTAGTLTFAPGERTKTVSVPVMGDRLDEPDEAFALALVDPQGATLGKAAGAALIADDETPRVAPSAVTSKTTPSRDRSLPFRFRTTGRVTLPSGVRKADGCAGKVQVRFKAGKKTISTRRVNLRKDCTFARGVSFGIKSRLRPGRLKVNVRFLGNAVLLPKSAKARFVRVGR